MSFALIQFRDKAGGRHVAASTGDGAFEISGSQSTYELALEAIAGNETLAQAAARRGRGPAVDLTEALNEGRLLAPIRTL